MQIAANYAKLREEIPDRVTIVLAGKTRSVEEIVEVIDAGATDLGQNYVQEAEQMYGLLAENANRIRWHMIGHLQTNKINKAIGIFDTVQTVDSITKAVALDKRVGRAQRDFLPVFIEINIGSEFAKAGIRPDEHEPFEPYMERFVTEMSALSRIRIEGLMTMGPRFGDPEKSRPYFKRTRKLFEKLANLDLPNVRMRHLSMGMTNSYKVAVEEGSNMVRLGAAVFGPRVR